MEAVPEAEASGAALSAFCCPLFCWPFWCYFRLLCPKPAVRQFGIFFLLYFVFFFGQHNCPVPAAWAALNESKSCYDSMAFPCRLP